MSKEFYESTSRSNVASNDRYKDCNILTDIETGELILSTREDITIPNRGLDVYHRVSSNEVDRLDMIAAQYYKDPLLWWIIAQANNIYDPITPLSPGTLVRIPDIQSLYGNNGILL